MTVCYVLAFLCFVLAAFGATVPRINLTAAGLALWVLAQLMPWFRVVQG